MNKEQQELSVKQKGVLLLIMSFLIVFVVIITVSVITFFDDVTKIQPKPLYNYKNSSITLNIFNSTDKDLKLDNIVFPKKSFIRINYSNKDKQPYVTDSGDIYIKNKYKKSKHNMVDYFLKTTLPECKLNKDIFSLIKNTYTKPKTKGLSLHIESNKNQGSIKFEIINKNNNYMLEILETSKDYINLAPRNIHNGINVFHCGIIKKDGEFIKGIKTLIFDSIGD